MGGAHEEFAGHGAAGHSAARRARRAGAQSSGRPEHELFARGALAWRKRRMTPNVASIALTIAAAAYVATAARTGAPLQPTLRDALTFHASFDARPDAEYALGDSKLYSAESMKQRQGAKPGLPGSG